MEMTEVPVKRFDTKKGTIETKEWVVSEKKVRLMINTEEVTILSASPSMIKELAVGYVVGGGFLNINDVKEVHVDGDTATILTEKTVDTARPVKLTEFPQISEVLTEKGTVESPSKVSASAIIKAVSKLQSGSRIWEKTHAVHSAALFTERGDILLLVEDVSRRNAFDKVIGYALLNGISSVSIAISGRISQDMVLKAGRVGISLVASRSTIIEPAVTAASALGITLIGYVRGSHLVIFAHPERVSYIPE